MAHAALEWAKHLIVMTFYTNIKFDISEDVGHITSLPLSKVVVMFNHVDTNNQVFNQFSLVVCANRISIDVPFLFGHLVLLNVVYCMFADTN